LEYGLKVGWTLYEVSEVSDDKAVVASSEKGLQKLMINISNVTQKYGMKIIVNKTNVMLISKQGAREIRTKGCTSKSVQIFMKYRF